jgi:uncharacterized protein (TIGR02145 family)
MKSLLLVFALVFSFFSFSQIPNYVPSNGLVGWWPFTGNANDLSVFGNNGTVNGATLTTDRFGNANQAYSFSESSQSSINVGNDSSFNFHNPNNFTISIWVNNISTLSINNQAIGYYMYKGNGGGNTKKWLIGHFATPFSLNNFNYVFHTNDLAGNFEWLCDNINNTPDYSIWHNIVYKRSNDTVFVYKDGVFQNSEYSSVNPDYYNNASLVFGRGENTSINAKLDDIGIWNRALTQQEITALYTSTAGTVSALNCNGFTQSGNLFGGQVASNVSVSVPYTGGNGGFYAGQTISSTGVTGLTATLISGTLANGNGTVSYTVTGTPSGAGNATFAVSLGGQSCNVVLPVTTLASQYPANSVFCANGPTAIVDVTNPTTGKTWMDRNLGASQVATSSTDAASYGDLYQWGRRADGHQCRTSPTTATLSSVDQPAHGNFIPAPNAPHDWRSPQNTNLWQGVNGVNNPCPSGYRVPTETELNNERLSWGGNNGSGAFASPLKLTLAGSRYYSNASLIDVGAHGYYWSSTVSGPYSRYLYFFSGNASINDYTRAGGSSIRCIKETVGSVGAINCNGTTQTGNLIINQAATSVSASVPYTAGNGGFYNAQTLSSTGVTGLTATLAAGTLANGAGSLTYTITGTPTSSGTASFAISIGGQSCTLNLVVYGVQPSYPAGTVNCNGNATIVNDVTNPTTGKTWMDRNLGASQVATSSTDQNAYGDLYQWGRRSDGHQCRTSPTTATLSSVDQPAHADFIMAPNAPGNWRTIQNNNLWQGVNGINNPCPSGYRLPTNIELDQERLTWTTNNSAGAFNSILKAGNTGHRFYSNGVLTNVNISAVYWTSTTSGLSCQGLSFDGSTASLIAHNRAYGLSVRCIKETMASMGSINCNGTTQTGNLIVNQVATSVSSSVPYTAGNGGIYNAQTLSSTGVTGLTATLAAGTLANGAGSLTYTITGTPTTSGTASFAISIGGQSCTLNLLVYGVQPAYPAGTVNCNGNATIVNDVTNPTTGKTWMDRNLGATQVATSSTDQNAYGDLYQWGRRADGHQCRTSPTTATLSSVDQPAHGNFILEPNAPYDWRSPQNNNLWQGVNGVNNPCPSGYRVPTDSEFDNERLSWTSNNSLGAIGTILKLPLGGARENSVGPLLEVGTHGNYWSDNGVTNNSWYGGGVSSRYLNFSGANAIIGSNSRGLGFSIRCIKETVGSVGSINCNGTTQTGNLIINQVATSVSSSVPFTAGNGGIFNAQTLSSTGVTGLTATLAAGTLANGAGSLTYTITGTPTTSGTASFAITIGGQSCTLNLVVYGVQPAYPAGTVNCNGNATIVNDVTNPTTGKIWMDRNLGASQVATSSTDQNAYGDLYQWGRRADGHQCRTSPTTATLSSVDQPAHGNFILSPNAPYDWRSPQNTNLWQGVNGVNNPCPSGYRVPTETEINNERMSWSINNSTGAVASPLKWTVAGLRDESSGSLFNVGTDGYYWSSTVSGPNSRVLDLSSSNALIYGISRADGFGLRCIKETVGSVGAINCNGSTQSGTLYNNQPASNVTASVPYTGGNGGYYPAQSISSTGVTGLTATISQGLFANGAGTLSFTISGTPSAVGTATFALNIGGQACSFTVNVQSFATLSATNSTLCNGQSTTITASVANAGTSCAAPGLSGTLTNGLVGYWPFCGNANDASGNGNNGTVNGATLTTDRFGNVGSAYDFNGATIEVPHNASLGFNPTGSFTVVFWFLKNSNSTPQHFMGKRSQYAHTFNWQLTCETNQMTFGSGYGPGIYNGLFYGTVQPSNIWTHLCAQYTNGFWILYLNGVQVSTSMLSANPDITSVLTFGNSGNFDPFIGKLDDIGIYNRAITQQEITQLYQQGQATYLWSNGATTPSIMVTPTQTTTYTCTITMNGATTTQSQTITVNPIPAVNAGQDQTVFAGTQVTLSGSGANSYSWNNGISNNMPFTANTTTTYTVTGTSNGCSSTDQVLVTVLPAPTLTINTNDTLCSGTSTTLTANVANAGTSCAAPGLSGTLTNGLVGYWPFCGNANDLSGNGNNGTVNGATLTTDRFGAANQAYSFDGVDDYCNLNSQLPNSFSISLWARIDSFKVYNGISSELLSTFNQNFGSSGFVFRTDAIPNKIVSGFWNINGNQIVSKDNIQQFQWNQYLLSYSSGLLKLYFNGIICDSIVGTYVQNNQNLFLAARQVYQGNNPAFFADCALDDIGIWNRSLTQAEITQLYNAGQATYSWSPGGATTPSITVSPTQTTTYTCTITMNGASTTQSQTITVNPVPTVSAGANQTVCAGTAVTLSGSGATSYTWNNNVQNGLAFTPNNTQTYTVTGTDANGCSNTAQTTVTVNPLPAASITAQGATTFCQNNSVTLNANAGAGLSYQWYNNGTAINAANSATLPVSTSGSYTVQVTNANNCSATSAATPVSVNALPAATITPASATTFCQGGSVVLNANVGQGLSYQWNLNGSPINGANAASYTANATGSYSLNVLNSDGCSATATAVSVTVNALPNVSAGANQTICSGTAVTLSGSGATSYSWNNNVSNGVAFTPNNTQTYTVTGTAANGCSNTAQVTVTVNALPTPSISYVGSPILCQGSVLALNATAGSSYLWSNGQTTQSIQATQGGAYTVQVTNANGCVGTSNPVTLTVNPLPAPSITAQGPTTFCQGGSVVLTSTGATSYSWSTNATTQSITVTTSGLYQVTVVDNKGCSGSSAPIQVTVLSPPSATITTIGANALCAGQSTTLSAPAGNTYLWSNGLTTQNITVNAAGTYSVQVTNGAGCSAVSAPVTINVNPVPAATITPNGVTSFCTGGSVVLTASAGSSYLWNNGATTQSITVNNSGSFTVTVTGAGGCNATSAATTVTVNANPSASITPNGPTTFCAGGTLLLSASAGSTYLWSNGASTPSLSVSSSGSYTVTVTNGAGCSSTSSAQIVTVNALPSVSAGNNQTICAGTAVTLSGSGAASYSWNNGVNNGVAFTPASTQTYTVTGTAANGCTNTAQVTVTVNALPSVYAGSNQTVCAGTAVTLSGSGAASYTWNNGVNNGVAFTPASTQTYTVTGTAANGCTNTAQVTVTVNALPSVSAGNNQTVCAGTAVTLSGSGAASYSWTNGVNNGVAFTPASTQTYTVTGTAANGCTNTAQVTVTVNALPSVSAGNNQTVCAGTAVTLSGSGAASYTWNNGVNNGVAFTPASTQTYTVTGTAANGCTNTAQVTVTVNALPTANAGTNALINCVNYPFGVSVGAAPQAGNTYSWSPSTGLSATNIANPLANPAATTTYTLTVTQTNTGCTASSQVVISVNNAAPQANAGQSATITCVNNTGGVLLGNNPTAGLSYAWSPSTGLSASTIANPIASPASTTTYTLTVTNASNGCTGTGTVTVTVNTTQPTVNAGPNQSICSGQSVTLTAAGANTYAWNNGAIQGVAFNPTTTQTYTVQGTNSANGCQGTAQVTVTVNALPTVSAGQGQTVCAGTAVTLSGSGTASYTWNNGVSNGVAFTPASTQTYTVTGTDANGCTNTAQVTVTVNPLPSVNAGPDQSVCAGTAVTLSGSGANTYTWNNGVSNGVAFTPTTTQTYTVTGTNANGCQNTDQITVTVNVLPTPTVVANGTAPYCPGTNVVMSTTAIAGYTYQWYFGQNIINGAVSATFTATTAGTYTVKVTAPGGCFATSNSITVSYLNPTITAQGPTSICQGGSVVLQTATGSGFQYTWMKNGMSMMNASNNATFTAMSPGTYTVKIVTPSGCVMYSNPITVSFLVNPTASISASGSLNICAGSSVTLSAANNANSVTYQWRKNGINISGATAQTYVVTQSGTYTVVIANQACPSTSAVVSNSLTVQVFPVPNPIISATATVVTPGVSVTLSTANGVGNTYQWYKLLGTTWLALPGATQSTYTTSSSGTFRVKVTNMYGCWKYSNSITITSSQMPEPGVSCLSDGIHVKHGEAVPLEGTWYEETPVDRTRIAAEWNEGAQEWVLTGKTEGNFVYVTMEEEAEMQWMRVADVCSERTLVAYPNPTWNVVYLKGLEAAEKHYELHDVMGRVVAVGNLSAAQNAIDMSNLAPGTYHLVLQGYGVIAILKE